MKKLEDYEREEYIRQDATLNFIASENLPSEAILEANSSILMNKYAEGFAQHRYYQGVKVVDELEIECTEECLNLFKGNNDYLANVQMSSGSQANTTVYHALLENGATVLAPDTASLGHITHGIKGSFLDRYYNVVKYGLTEDGLIDKEQVRTLARKHLPSLIICGASNYSQPINFDFFARIRDIVRADKIAKGSSLGLSTDSETCYLMADISHIAGLVVTGHHESPIGKADAITTTLHKTLRGVRGAIILYKKELDKKIKFATIPGLWGGSHLNNTLAKLQTFREAKTSSFESYIGQVLRNTKAMANIFIEQGIPVVSGGTENHVFCLDLTDFPINGKDLAEKLESIGIVSNANAIPNDTSFIKPHGLRLGCAAVTTRGLKEEDCILVARGIAAYLNALEEGSNKRAENTLILLAKVVEDITKEYPISTIYPHKYSILFKDK